MWALGNGATVNVFLSGSLERGRVVVARLCYRFEPGNYLVGGSLILPVQRPPLQDALDRLGHIQPGAAQWYVERHDPMRDQPIHHHGRFMTG